MFPESGFHTVSLGSPKPPSQCLCLQSCQLPVPYTAVVLTIGPLTGLFSRGKGRQTFAPAVLCLQMSMQGESVPPSVCSILSTERLPLTTDKLSVGVQVRERGKEGRKEGTAQPD